MIEDRYLALIWSKFTVFLSGEKLPQTSGVNSELTDPYSQAFLFKT